LLLKNLNILFFNNIERNPVKKEPNNPNNQDIYTTEDFYIGNNILNNIIFFFIISDSKIKIK